MYKTIITTLLVTLTGATVASAMYAGQSINEMEEKKMTDKKENGIIRTEKAIESGVVKGYKAIENGVVRGYKGIENGVVKGYKAIEDAFVETFFAEDPRVEAAEEQTESADVAADNAEQVENTEAAEVSEAYLSIEAIRVALPE